MPQVTSNPDLVRGGVVSQEVTLSGTPNTVTSISVPDNAQGVKMYPSADIRFALNENPVGKSTSALVAGGIGKAGLWEVRLLLWAAGRTLRLMSATASAVVEVEFF